MHKILAIVLAVAFVLAARVLLQPELTLSTPGPGELTGFLQRISSSAITLSSDNCSPAAQAATIAVSDVNLQASLASFQPCDRVIADVSGAAPALILTNLRPQAASLSGGQRAKLLFVFAAFLLAVTLFFARDIRKLLFIGQDNRYSNSITQVSLWFLVTVTSYLAAFFIKARYGVFGVGIPTNLLMLSGLSALSFVGAKGITNKKANDAEAAGAAERKSPDQPRFPQDYVLNDRNQFDFGDYQMILITLVAIVSYLVHVFQFLGGVELRALGSMPDVDTTMLGLFGVGQGAYLVKKSVSDVKS